MSLSLEKCHKTSMLNQHHCESLHASPIRARSAIQSVADLPGSLIPTAEQLMQTTPFWVDDLSGMSHQHVLGVMAENRAWNKRLREGTAALVNTRLAKTITQEEYARRRNETKDDVAECKRRAGILGNCPVVR